MLFFPLAFMTAFANKAWGSVIVVLLAALGMVLVGCVSQSQAPSDYASTPTPASTLLPTSELATTPTAAPVVTPTPLSTPSPSPSPQGQVKEFSITARQYDFQPSTITVKKGDLVKLKITSLDVTHGFSLPDFNVNANLEPGKETTVEFTADKAGSFTFFCSVFCGSGHSEMKGTLVVEE